MEFGNTFFPFTGNLRKGKARLDGTKTERRLNAALLIKTYPDRKDRNAFKRPVVNLCPPASPELHIQ